MKTYQYCLIILILFFAGPARALDIFSIKGRNVLLRIRGDEAPLRGQRLVVIDGRTEKEVGLLEITNTGINRVAARLIRGRVRLPDYVTAQGSNIQAMEREVFTRRRAPPSRWSMNPERLNYRSIIPNDSLVASNDRTPASTSGYDSEEAMSQFEAYRSAQTSTRFSKEPIKFGFGMGFSPLSINVTSSSGTRELRGVNFVAKTHLTVPLQPAFSLDLGATWMPLSASTADATLGTAKFQANYLALDGIARINLWKTESSGPWIGAGLSYLYLMDGTSNLIKSSSMSSEVVFQLSAGINKKMSKEHFCYRFDYLFYGGSLTSTSAVDSSQYLLSGIYFY